MNLPVAPTGKCVYGVKINSGSETFSLLILATLCGFCFLTPASARRAVLLGVQVILPVLDVILQSPWQRQETHEGG